MPPDQVPAVAMPLAMMPGAPRVKVPSLAEMTIAPFTAKASVGPLPSASRSCQRPARSL